MTSDSAIPDSHSQKALSDVESVSALSDVESDSAVHEPDENPVLPDEEVDSVLLYLKSNSTLTDDVNLDSVPDAQSSELALPDAINHNVNLDSALLDISSELPLPENVINYNVQVQIKNEEGRMLLILPTESQMPGSESNWTEIWQQMKLRLNAGARFFTPNTTVHLVAQDRLLDSRQLQELAESLGEIQIHLKSVSTSRRQTAIAAVSSGYSVEQLKPETSLTSASEAATPQQDSLYLEMTVRSGVEIRHPGSVIILGDVNPGGIVVADGDILVWGRLRGIAHAGAIGNRECLIMALQMEPTQLRIADAVARGPEQSPMQFYPEVAYITPQGIRITKAIDFSRMQLSRMNQ